MRAHTSLLLVVALLGVPSGALAAETREERIAAVLRRPPSSPRDVPALGRELARLGPELIPLWRRWLVGEGVDAVFLAHGEFRPELWAVRPEAAGELALATLAALPAEAVLSDLQHGIRRDGPGPSEYLAAFRVLEVLGSARGLALYWEMVERLGSDVTELPRYRQAADAALAAMLARDRECWPALARRLPGSEELELELFLSAAHDAGRPEAHELVLRLLDGGAALSRSAALRTLARLEREHPWRCEPELVERVTRAWPALAPEERLGAIAWLGASEDPRAVAPLRRWLDELDPLVASAAARALAELGGIDLGRDETAWEQWEERELLWWTQEHETVLEELAGGASAAAAGFAELASHPLFRRELARAVGGRLLELEPALQPLGAAFLQGLRTRAALPALARLALAAEDPALRTRLQADLLALGIAVSRPSAEPETPTLESL